jgi:hypothetical protein
MKAVQLKTVLPAPAKPTFAEFDNFTKEAQRAVGIYSRLNRACNELHEYCGYTQIGEAEKTLEYFEKHERKIIARCAAGALRFEPDDAYDDDGIKKAQISKHVSMLLGSFPNANPSDPEVYTMMLIEEVVAVAPTVVTLEAACRSIRRTSKFLPTISEVLEALAAQSKLWRVRNEALDCYDDAAQELRAKIAEHRARLATKEADRVRRNAKAQPIAVGDRVRSVKAGTGTVIELRPMDGAGGMHFAVAFDNGVDRHVAGAQFLERLVEGEEGFEKPVPAAEVTE